MKNLKTDNQYFFKMFRFMKPYFVPYAFGMLFFGSQNFSFTFISSLFMSNITAAIIALSSSGVIASVLTFIAMMFAFMLIIGVGMYMYVMTEAKAVRDLKQKLFRSFVTNSIENASGSHSGEGIAAINTDANTATEVYGNPLRNILECVSPIILGSVVVFTADWRIGFGILGVGLIAFLAQHRFTKPLSKIGTDQLEANADSVKEMSNIFSGAMAIRSFNLQDKAFVTFDREAERIKILDFKRAFINMWQNLFTTLEGWLTLVVVFALGGWLVATGRLEFPVLMLVFGMSQTITNSFSQIGQAYANMQPPIAAAKRVFNILEAGDERKAKKEQKTDVTLNSYSLNINDLNFRYLDAEQDTLSNISFDVNENQMIALVGESGSGKSTLLRAIIGMYERDNLGMNLGGIAFDDSPINSWRHNFAYVDQSCKLFDMSVRENIAMGAAGKANEDVIIASAKRAAAHEFIGELEGGYDAPCGEKGGTLSGGQKQRIAIARALAKQAHILVFDEATSALDTESERYIMDTIHSLRNDHTILITTHNLENIITADKIIVMDNGNIAEMGTHNELIQKNGIYTRLYTQ